MKYKVFVWSIFDKCYNALSGLYERSEVDELRAVSDRIIFTIPFSGEHGWGYC